MPFPRGLQTTHANEAHHSSDIAYLVLGLRECSSSADKGVCQCAITVVCTRMAGGQRHEQADHPRNMPRVNNVCHFFKQLGRAFV
jgi:hypothetical protein